MHGNLKIKIMKKWQNISITVLVFLIVITFAIFNGLVINWAHEHEPIARKLLSSQWHAIGTLTKLLVGLIPIVLLWKKWLYMLSFALAYFIIQWSGYNIIINLLIGQSWDYIGGTSWVDLWGRSHPIWFWTLQVLSLVLAIAISIYALIKERRSL